MTAKGIGSLLVLGTILALATFYFPGDASSAGGTTERVSVDSSGNEGDDHSGWGGEGRPGISGDGRFVAFFSEATNLVLNDGNEAGDVFVHDRETGTTERVSVDSSGNEGNDHSYGQAISGDGRFVAFSSWATNLVPDDTNTYCDNDYDGNYDENCRDVFVHDRETGITERVSVDTSGNEGNGESWEPAISADGRFVAFSSAATNLVPGDINGFSDVFVHDRVTRVTERVGVWGEAPDITGNGRFVAFLSHATLVPEDTNGVRDVYVHDRLTGAYEIVSVSSTGDPANAQSWYPSITGDGRFVAFSGGATNLVPHDPNGSDADVFVHDQLSGITERISWQSPEDEEDTAAAQPSMTGDGHVVAFIGICRYQCGGGQIVVRDLQTGATEVASVANNGDWGDAPSFHPSISSNGRFVAFSSQAFNLVPDDYNDKVDVFVHDRAGGGPTPTPTPTPEPETLTYIATGDSIPSGVDLGTDCDHDPHPDPSDCRANPTAAYPQYLADRILAAGISTDVDLQNIACSGATTDEYKNGVRCAASQGKSQLDYVTTSEVAPELITVTISANDYALTGLYGKCLEPSLKSGRLDFLRKAAACSKQLVQNQDSKKNPNSLTHIGENLDSILRNLRLTYPNAIIAVTTYYNPAPEEVDNFACWANPTCRYYFLDPINEILSSTDSLFLHLNAEIIETTIPHFAASGGKVRLVDAVDDEFDGHCGFFFGATITGKVKGISQSITVNLGCDSSASWIAPRDETSGSGNIKKGPIEVTYNFQAGVHPNMVGQQCIANMIWEEIKGQMGSSDPPDSTPCS